MLKLTKMIIADWVFFSNVPEQFKKCIKLELHEIKRLAHLVLYSMTFNFLLIGVSSEGC